MKKILLITSLLITFLTFGQVPQGISYQAIALNGSGNPVASSNVGLRLSILDNSSSGTVLYTETHTKTTNAQGLFNTVIGQGTPSTGTFSAINWGANSKFLKVELDAAGGTSYTLVGTTQLLSVPYAMMAGNVTNINPSILSGLGTDVMKSGTFIALDGSSLRGFYNGSWSSQPLSGSISTSNIINSNGNFVIIDGSTLRGFYNGVWSSQTLSGSTSTSNIISSNGNFVILDGLSIKAFSNGAWSTQSLSSSITTSNIIGSNGNFVVLNGASLKGFCNGVWSSQALSSSISTSNIIGSNGNFVILDGSSLRGFNNGTWQSQLLSGPISISNVIKSDKN